ncbi:hypothetical protein NW249_23695 [Streptomyces sp. OUCMDZ-4982]|uniref:hypothetical protein n=1 Tax=Streptomyces sp. OUCMDZ-4982 TaxID=2973090 RepID=UPI00215C5C06|nr:hypothetical protein [Streptomyces sp. OUCMDZ-4982]MCR8945125.1 hypothetical protein [Streptomyces sp. OUCMDZ-4982]
MRSTFIDALWIEQPGELLAQEVEDAEDIITIEEPALLAQACRGFSRYGYSHRDRDTTTAHIRATVNRP